MRVYFYTIFLITLIIVSIGKETLADENAGAAGAFLRRGVGARALGMGGAFVAVSDDPTATYWNPGGLAQIKRIQLTAMYADMSLDRNYNFIGGILPFRVATFGISWIGFGISGIEARTSNSTQPEYVFNDSENAFLFSFAKGFTSHLAIGVNVKVLYHSLDKQQAFGTGFDAGLLIRPLRSLKFGITFQDIQTNLRWAGRHQEYFPLCMRLGTSYRIAENFLIALDAFKQEKGAFRVSWGTEYKPLNAFPFRIGTDKNGDFVLGAGLEIPLNTTKFALDYSFSKDALDGGNTHKISMTFSFGKYKLLEKFRSTSSIVQITVKRLNVRTGPGTKFKLIARVKKGQKFVKIDTRGNWYKIKISNTIKGWIHAKYARELKKRYYSSLTER